MRFDLLKSTYVLQFLIWTVYTPVGASESLLLQPLIYISNSAIEMMIDGGEGEIIAQDGWWCRETRVQNLGRCAP